MTFIMDLVSKAEGTGTPTTSHIQTMLQAKQPEKVVPSENGAVQAKPPTNSRPLTDIEATSANMQRLSPSEFRRWQNGEQIREKMTDSKDYHDKMQLDKEWRTEENAMNVVKATEQFAATKAEQVRQFDVAESARLENEERPRRVAEEKRQIELARIEKNKAMQQPGNPLPEPNNTASGIRIENH